MSRHIGRVLVGVGGAAAIVLLATSCTTTPKQVTVTLDPKVAKPMSAMLEMLKTAPAISYTAQEFIDKRRDDGLLVQDTASFNVQMVRPDKLRVDAKLSNGDLTLWFDAGALVLLDNKKKLVATRTTKATTVDALIEMWETKRGVSLPGGDLLLSDPIGILAWIETSEHVGQEEVDGEKRDHLAFTQGPVTWQVWIAAGAKPLPRRLVIVEHSLEDNPQYEVAFSNWNLDKPRDHSAFAPVIPKDAKAVEPSEILAALEME